MTKHEIYVFNKTNYNSNKPVEDQIIVGKPYMLIEQKHERVIMGAGDRIGDLKEVSYFYALNEQHEVVQDKVYEVATNWWHTEASFKNARILGTITSKKVYSSIEYCDDY